MCPPQQAGSGVRATILHIHKLHIGTFALPLLQGWGSAAFVPSLTMRLGTTMTASSCKHVVHNMTFDPPLDKARVAAGASTDKIFTSRLLVHPITDG